MQTSRRFRPWLAAYALAVLTVACGGSESRTPESVEPVVGTLDGRLITMAEEPYTAACDVLVYASEQACASGEAPMLRNSAVDAEFRLEGLPVGDCWISIVTTDPNINARYAAAHHVSPGEQTASFFMLEGARLTGRVIDIAGDGVPAIIDLYDIYEPRGPGEPQPALFESTDTDEAGVFVFEYVMPGKKFVQARRPGTSPPDEPPALDRVSILEIAPNTDVDAGTLTVR